MRVAVCEDDKQTCADLAGMVRRILPEVQLELFTNAEDLLDCGNAPDIILLDIELDGMDGLEAARRLRSQGSDCAIVFVTGKDQYVFSAFDVGAVHYLLKPVDAEKLAQVLRKTERALTSDRSKAGSRQLLITSEGSRIRVPADSIRYAEVFNRIIVLHTTNGEIRYYGRLSELETQCGETFFRTHRSYLVNMRFVESYTGTAVNMAGSAIPISKKQYPVFVRTFLEYIRGMNC